MISKRGSHKIYQKGVCLKAYIAYGSIIHLWYINELQPRKSQENITTNNKGTRASWDIFEKGNKYHKGIHLANSSILHIRAL